MATETRKVLGQIALPATTLTPLYTVPSLAEAVVSTLYVCNRGDYMVFRLSVAVAGEADNPKQYLYYDIPIPANETLAATVGITMAATDEIRGYASTPMEHDSVWGGNYVWLEPYTSHQRRKRI